MGVDQTNVPTSPWSLIFTRLAQTLCEYVETRQWIARRFRPQASTPPSHGYVRTKIIGPTEHRVLSIDGFGEFRQHTHAGSPTYTMLAGG